MLFYYDCMRILLLAAHQHIMYSPIDLNLKFLNLYIFFIHTLFSHRLPAKVNFLNTACIHTYVILYIIIMIIIYSFSHLIFFFFLLHNI